MNNFLSSEDQIFLVFYAIFWGFVTEAQHPWKPFQLPLFCRQKWATRRAILSVMVLNVLPLTYFGYVIRALKDHPEPSWATHSTLQILWHLVAHGVVPAFAIFGFYRFWLSIVEGNPDWFYASDANQVGKYQHAEPTYRIGFDPNRQSDDRPIVNLGPDTCCWNLFWALSYIVVSGAAPWIAR